MALKYVHSYKVIVLFSRFLYLFFVISLDLSIPCLSLIWDKYQIKYKVF